MRPVLLLAPFLILAACGTPQEQCIQRATSELRRVENLLAEVQGNIARGYAWEEYTDTITRWEVCGYEERARKDGTVVRKPQMCLEDHDVTRRRQVAIDPAAERRKRDGLIAKRAELTRVARAQIEQCRQLYPEDEAPK